VQLLETVVDLPIGYFDEGLRIFLFAWHGVPSVFILRHPVRELNA